MGQFGTTCAVLHSLLLEKNAIGEAIPRWQQEKEIQGTLDYLSGSGGYLKQGGIAPEASHVFLCEYMPLEKRKHYRLEAEGAWFDVVLADDPAGLHRHLELYLKDTGEAKR